MRNFFVLIFVISTLTITINCSLINHRTKRNPQGFMDKIKTGLIDFGVGTKNVFTKGYEETKNLFSSDRKVGDYIYNDINVRSNFNYSGDSQESEGQKVESATIRTKRELKEDEKTDEHPDDYEEEEQSKSEDSSEEDEDVEESTTPGPPLVGSIFIVPLSCRVNEVLVRGVCRRLA